MDFALWVVAIIAINVAVFLAGCLLAAYRAWTPPASRERPHESNGTPPA